MTLRLVRARIEASCRERGPDTLRFIGATRAGSDNAVSLRRHAVAVAGILGWRFLIGAGKGWLRQIRRFITGQVQRVDGVRQLRWGGFCFAEAEGRG
jgi:hypothetical protein